jgi:hypothetical protein
MSAASDKFENDVAKNINKIPGIKALRPKVSTEYSDVKIEVDKFKGENAIWLEVKMSHTDNLSNPRVFYEKGKWHTTYKTPAAKHTVDILNKSAQAKKFIKDIAKFSGIPEKMIKIPTNKGGLKEEGAVPLSVMKAYFSQPNINRYIANEENYNLGDVVTEHYTIGKAKPAYYMQAGDDFYMISKNNPLKIKGIPVLSGSGDFKVRVSTRSLYYEVQAEIKIKEMPKSKFSVAPGTKKQNPFLSMSK